MIRQNWLQKKHVLFYQYLPLYFNLYFTGCPVEVLMASSYQFCGWLWQFVVGQYRIFILYAWDCAHNAFFAPSCAKRGRGLLYKKLGMHKVYSIFVVTTSCERVNPAFLFVYCSQKLIFGLLEHKVSTKF